MDAVRNMAKGLNRNITKQVAASLDADLATEVLELTKEELDKGWAWLDDDCDFEQHVLAKRFGLKQGAKRASLMIAQLVVSIALVGLRKS